MFEKEAEEYVPNINWHAYSSKEIREEMMLCYRKGAEFGYNKANEWHDLRKNPDDLPPNEHEVYIAVVNETARGKGLIYGFDRYLTDDEAWLIESEQEVIAWCEIPRYTEEV